MIGVVCKATDSAVVEEFFQLFKTPWEFFRDGAAYDVVVSAGGTMPQTDARAILVYGAEAQKHDKELGIRPSALMSGGALDVSRAQLPIHGRLLTFEETGTSVLRTLDGARTAGLKIETPGATIHRFGYDLFEEITTVLVSGQPLEQAQSPSIDLHIAIMRQSILDSGVPVLEVPPIPAGYEFTVCLTHDIDFVGIRRHKFDHTMWGFLYRATFGGVIEFLRGKLTISRLLKRFKAALSLPLVYAGLLDDFWMPFEWHLEVEKGLPATYFLIPFKNRPGEKLKVSHSARRATKYDVTDLPDWIQTLTRQGCEIGVHGIDAWHSPEKGHEELARVSSMSGQSEAGIRMHWLLCDRQTFEVLEQAGYAYDSTAGYNETVGYRSGTHQVFRPLSARKLLEMPLHIQDGALFFPQQLGLSDEAAWPVCWNLVENARKFGGVLTLLWHDRSFGPERFWGDFYIRLLERIRMEKVWFASAGQAVAWFRQRRAVVFSRDDSPSATTRARLCSRTNPGLPPMTIRVHQPDAAARCRGQERRTGPRTEDYPWTEGVELDLSELSHRSDAVGQRVPAEAV